MGVLPVLTNELLPTRDYIREVALALSAVQRGFLPAHPRSWQYGLEVTMRGLGTQPLLIEGQEQRATLDLVAHKVRFGGNMWPLQEYRAPEILAHVKAWLGSKGIKPVLDEPKFAERSRRYDTAQAQIYAEALWWTNQQFNEIKEDLSPGESSPILLYPHHFDLSLVWFPDKSEKQLAIGWSTGDEIIPEAYLYMTAYPEPAGFAQLKLPTGAYHQTEGFSGMVLPYSVLQTSKNPEALFKEFASGLLKQAERLL